MSICSYALSTLSPGALCVRVLVVLNSWPGHSSGPVLSGSDACSVSANCGFVFQCALCFFLQDRAEVLDTRICKLAFSAVPVVCGGEEASRSPVSRAPSPSEPVFWTVNFTEFLSLRTPPHLGGTDDQSWLELRICLWNPDQRTGFLRAGLQENRVLGALQNGSVSLPCQKPEICSRYLWWESGGASAGKCHNTVAPLSSGPLE